MATTDQRKFRRKVTHHLAGFGERVRATYRGRERITCNPKGDGCCDLEYRCEQCGKWRPFHNGGTDVQWCDDCWLKWKRACEGRYSQAQ